MEMEILLLKYYLMTQSSNLQTRIDGYFKLLTLVKENGLIL
jgi:hypothetical protein